MTTDAAYPTNSDSQGLEGAGPQVTVETPDFRLAYVWVGEGEPPEGTERFNFLTEQGLFSMLDRVSSIVKSIVDASRDYLIESEIDCPQAAIGPAPHGDDCYGCRIARGLARLEGISG